MENVKKHIQKSFLAAKKAHNYTFDNSDTRKRYAPFFAVQALTSLSVAEAIYYSRYKDEYISDCEEYFNLLHQFADELLNDYAEDHSPQHVDIKFSQLKDYFNNSPFCFECK